MRRRVHLLRSRHLSQIAVLAVIAATGTACSDGIGRFGTPNQRDIIEGNAAAAPSPAAPAAATPAPSAPVTGTQLPPIGTATTGTATTAPAAAQSGAGRTITVQPGETLYSLSGRYAVPVDWITTANGITDPSSITAGRQLFIPSSAPSGPVNAGTTTTAAPPVTGTLVAAPQGTVAAPGTNAAGTAGAAPGPQNLGTLPTTPTGQTTAAPQATTPAPAGGQTYTVAAGDNLGGIARRYGVSAAELAAANGMTVTDTIRIGQTLRIPAPGATTTTAQATPPATPTPQAQTTQTPPATTTPAPQTTTPPAAATPPATPPAQQTTTPAAATTPAAPSTAGSLRWPVQGRIIANFNGQANPGINISVPVGTPVLAAESGTVEYAGNEIAGYGNLVLIRHPNGLVTAYAHMRDIAVRQGDAVTRGQTIGTAGMTGSVTAPQLHFEVRDANRGNVAVDPVPYLG